MLSIYQNVIETDTNNFEKSSIRAKFKFIFGNSLKYISFASKIRLVSKCQEKGIIIEDYNKIDWPKSMTLKYKNTIDYTNINNTKDFDDTPLFMKFIKLKLDKYISLDQIEDVIKNGININETDPKDGNNAIMC